MEDRSGEKAKQPRDSGCFESSENLESGREEPKTEDEATEEAEKHEQQEEKQTEQQEEKQTEQQEEKQTEQQEEKQTEQLDALQEQLEELTVDEGS